MEKSTSNFIFDKESLSAFKIALGSSARDTTMYSRRVSLQIYVQRALPPSCAQHAMVTHVQHLVMVHRMHVCH